MAKTKYDFEQETQYGRITYRDVPSYSPDFLGTTGDAVLVRQFIKNYLPFYKTSVTSSTGSSIRVKILETNWSARYSVQNSVVKVGLNSTWLQDILEPLFEGKGFDGMQDLEYSKPLPKLINTSDQNQEVSYGHNYIFVDPKDLVYQGFVDLDHKTGKGYPYEIVEGGVNIIKTGYVPIDAIILKYIKGELTAPNEGDLVTLEKGPTVPVSNVILTMAQQEMVDFLALNGIVSLQYIKENFKTSRLYGRAELIKELISMDLVVADSQSPPLYQLTQLGYDSVSEVGTIPYLTKEQLKVLYALSLNEGQIAIGVKNLAVITDYPEDLVINVVNALEVFKLIDVFNNSNQVQKRTYAISKLGQEYLDKKNSQDEKANIATPTNPNNGNLAEAKETFVDSLSSAADGGIYKNAVKEFIDNNADAFKIMGKEDPDLYTAILSGLSFVLGQQTIKDANLEPFKSLENQQQLEDDVILNDLISDDDLGDLDLDDLDLQEIDLSGLQEDIEINEDELGDLSDFDELKDFVDSELMPSIPPVDIENLDALQKNILMILDKPPAKGKGLFYNEMDQSEIWAEVDETIANEYARFDVQTALDALIGLKLVTALNAVPVDYRLIDDKRTSETIAKIKNEVPPEVKLIPSQYKVLKVLYDNNNRYPMAPFMDADSIGIVLKQETIALSLAHNQILKKLGELVDLELVKLKNDQKGGIMFSITDEGIEYVKNNTKINVGQSQGALRPSPSESATINSVGAIKTGNDGNSWEVKENKNGVKRWVKI